MNREVLRRYIDVLFNRCMRILGNRASAQDVVQNCLLRYYELSQQKTIHEPLHYLYRSCTHRCVDVLRAQKKSIPLPEKDLHHFWGISLHQAEHRLLVERLYERFGKESMQLLFYRYLDHMSYREIAEVMGKSHQGIKKKIIRIEAQMKKYLERS